jgi:Uma2 family endonuclease
MSMKAVVNQMPPHWLAERKNSDVAQWDEMWDGVLHMPPMPNGIHQDFELDVAAYLKRRWAKPRGAMVRHGVNLTTPADEDAWTKNYRVPDIVLLTPDRFHIDKNEYMAGAPLVVIEIRSPDDETYDKFPFYAALGVPEVWVFHRDTKVPEVHALGPGPAYRPRPADPDGWLRSPAAGVEFRQTRPGKVWLRVAGDEATAEELPD